MFITEETEPRRYVVLPESSDNYLSYRLWWNDVLGSVGLNRQHFDQALMAFGQFLSNRWGRLLR